MHSISRSHSRAALALRGRRLSLRADSLSPLLFVFVVNEVLRARASERADHKVHSPLASAASPADVCATSSLTETWISMPC